MANQTPFGVTEQEAQQQLVTYLHTDLEEPQAELSDLHVEGGRWQAQVNNSQRGIRVVFLMQHGGQIEPGFMNADAHPDKPQTDIPEDAETPGDAR